jgi:hypothetical protein
VEEKEMNEEEVKVDEEVKEEEEEEEKETEEDHKDEEYEYSLKASVTVQNFWGFQVGKSEYSLYYS